MTTFLKSDYPAITLYRLHDGAWLVVGEPKIEAFRAILEDASRKLDEFRTSVMSNDYDFLDGRLWEAVDDLNKAREALRFCVGYRSASQRGVDRDG